MRTQPTRLVSILALAVGCTGCAGGQNVSCAEPPDADAQNDTSPKHTNRLAKETSPYLLQHAHNPVDWYAWGPEAFAKAKQENKVVFLSIGYSSCHWCHVMERESFLDQEIADYLNEFYVCIKVDREERPDVDSIYMTSLQVFNQMAGTGRGGGWPMSIFMTPQAKPFFAGSYFPARDGDRGAGTGFLTILERIQEIWSTRKETLEKDAQTLTGFVSAELAGRHPAELASLPASLRKTTLAALERQFDPDYGGFGFNVANPFQPKFPEPSKLRFLVNVLRDENAAAEDKERARRMLLTTLDRMAHSGMRDHLGGGFHRYSVDRFWRIPHFEKMLYDNAQLVSIYTHAHQLTGRAEYRRVVEQALAYVRRAMTDPGHGFYAALDAESEGQEGKFYRWTREEIVQVLGEPESALLRAIYGVDGPPNFEERFYVLQLRRSLVDEAVERQSTEATLESELEPLRKQLLAYRDARVRPLTDTKVLTSWNGLMIRGFADAGCGLDQAEYVRVAERAADFALSSLRSEDGRLLRTFSAGQARLNGYLDDYAFLVDGLIGLYEATGQEKWLQAADDLTARQIDLFWDETDGGFFFTSADHETLLARGRDPVDGAEPSGNSVSAGNLLYLGRELDRPDYLDKAESTLRSMAGFVHAAPAAAPRMVEAVLQWRAQQSP